MIGVINYGMGNIGSVVNAIYHLGYDAQVISNVFKVEDFTHLIIPGVGSYNEAMINVNKKGLIGPIKEFASSGKPLLGICLGMQILSTYGLEGGKSEGLGLIDGIVDFIDADETLILPHVGWNDIDLKVQHPMLDGIKSHIDFYFVHSYAFQVGYQRDVIASVDYGYEFPAIIGKNNVVGIQFHPEKSQDSGLKIIENFLEWDGEI